MLGLGMVEGGERYDCLGHKHCHEHSGGLQTFMRWYIWTHGIRIFTWSWTRIGMRRMWRLSVERLLRRRLDWLDKNISDIVFTHYL
jgi:hypothetical protein